MNDRQVGQALRAVRIRRGLTQDEVGVAARTSRFVVSRLERGLGRGISLDRLRSVGAALEIDIDVVVRWRGGDLGRLLNARHAALHEAFAMRLKDAAGWMLEPEVSYSIFGERGVIDALAFHPATSSLLVVELKTEIVDVSALMGSTDRRRRLARQIAGERGWAAQSVSTWVLVAECRANRRALARHETVLRTKFPDDGHRVRTFLSAPEGTLRAISFMSIEQMALTGARVAGVRRVCHAPSRIGDGRQSGQLSASRS